MTDMSWFSLSYTVTASETINASVEQVWNALSTFEQQRIWSPWYIQEPTAKTSITGTDGTVGAISSREGERIGAGQQEIIEIEAQSHMVTKLNFMKPRKAESMARLTVESQGEQTVVTWTLDGSVPLFLFWMRTMLKRMVGKDYARGLMMLKDYVETGSLDTTTTYEGEVESVAAVGIGIQKSGHESTIGEVMMADYEELMNFFQEYDLPLDGGFALYPKADMKTGMFTFVSCLKADPSLQDTFTLPEGRDWYDVPATKAVKVTHTGDYKYLQNSWMAVYGAVMSLKKKVNKVLSPYELYVIGPGHTQVPADWVTEIYVPIR